MPADRQDDDASASQPLIPKPRSTTGRRFRKAFAGFALGLVGIVICMYFFHQNQYGRTFILHNANLYTMDPRYPNASAFVVENGRFVDVGTDQDILEKWNGLKSIDMNNFTIVPGLIDAHGHLMDLGSIMTQPSLNDARSVAQVRSRLLAFLAESKTQYSDKGPWLVGWGWDQTFWEPAVFPCAADLDSDPMLREIPIVLKRRDGHAMWVNGRVIQLLKVAGVDLEKIENVPGGEIVREPGLGVLLDDAMDFVERILPLTTDSQRYTILSTAIKFLHSVGLTSIQDAGVEPEDIRFFQRAHSEGRFGIRNYVMISCPQKNEYCGDMMPKFETEDGMLKVASVKLYLDGALGSWGAAMLEPYSDAENSTGILRIDPATLNGLVDQWLDNGYQVNAHCIGDRANRVIMDAFEQYLRIRFGENADALRRNNLRLRIEHAQIVAPDDFVRAGRLAIIPSMQPTHATSDMGYAEQRLGDRARTEAYGWRSFLNGGVPAFPLSSDFPIEHPSPIAGFYAAVTRKYPDGTSPHGPNGWFPEQKLTRLEALRGFTLDAAYSAFMEDQLGSVSKGKHADFVVLSQDIMEVEEGKILETAVVATVVGGEVKFGSLSV